MFGFFNKTVYSLDVPPHLIQSIRIYQSLMEVGLCIAINSDQLETFKYLSKYFTTNYKVGPESTKKIYIEMSHTKPFVKLGETEVPLLFPHEVLTRCHKQWMSRRKTKSAFIGLLTPERTKVLNKYRLEKDKDLQIIESTRGREFPIKAWDEDYYKSLCDTEFTLCPNGDFVWTYRFFESVICGSVPIVEDSCDLYKGFIYYKMSDNPDKLKTNKNIQNHNFELAIKRLTLSKETIKNNI